MFLVVSCLCDFCLEFVNINRIAADFAFSFSFCAVFSNLRFSRCHPLVWPSGEGADKHQRNKEKKGGVSLVGSTDAYRTLVN